MTTQITAPPREASGRRKESASQLNNNQPDHTALQDKSTTVGTPRPVGQQLPAVTTLFLGSLLWSPPETAAPVLQLVTDEDLGDPFLMDVLQSIRRLNHAGGLHDAALVADDLGRAGLLSGERGRLLTRFLSDAATCGADAIGLRAYATAVVAEAYRCGFLRLGEGLVENSDAMAESDLLPHLVEAGARLRAHSERLTLLRGGADR